MKTVFVLILVCLSILVESRKRHHHRHHKKHHKHHHHINSEVTGQDTGGGKIVSNVHLTVYDAHSNTPSGYKQPFGDGSYNNPDCVAVSENSQQFPKGHLVYVKAAKKYYKVGDTCEQCTTDEKSGLIHIDLYIGGGTQDIYTSCEASGKLAFADNPSDVIVDPPSDLPVHSEAFCDQ